MSCTRWPSFLTWFPSKLVRASEQALQDWLILWLKPTHENHPRHKKMAGPIFCRLGEKFGFYFLN